MAKTPAERMAETRERRRSARKCVICGAPAAPGKASCRPCIDERRAPGTPHTCKTRGGFGIRDPACARCREIQVMEAEAQRIADLAREWGLTTAEAMRRFALPHWSEAEKDEIAAAVMERVGG